MKKMKFYLIPVAIISFLLLVGFTASNCGNFNLTSIWGNGKIITEERTVSDYASIEASGAFNIVLSQGSENRIKIEADENIMKHIKTEVKNNCLKLYTDASINNPHKMDLYITYKDLTSIESDGACNITGNSEIQTEKFTIDISGATDLKLKITTAQLNIVVSGAGNIDLSGFADKQNIEMSGASSYDASGLTTNYTTIDLSGAGCAKINAVKEINGELSGVGSILYKGEPPVKNISVSGLGTFSKII
jgi:hypothetical protein